MIALAFDENFSNDVLRGLLRRNPTLDLVRVQDTGLAGQDDAAVRVGPQRKAGCS